MANQPKLGKIEKVNVRDVWPHEALNFTKWLAQEENLTMLGDACSIELELKDTESAVGSFAVDIYAQEADTERKVIIENQLEDTNHDHLGKIITYAAGKGAGVVIWVVARARDEHRNAIEWLNEHTDSDCAFFLVEIEVWRIGDSPMAPRFNVVESPNEWARAEKPSRISQKLSASNSNTGRRTSTALLKTRPFHNCLNRTSRKRIIGQN